jgi:tight adherence protein B
VTALVLIFVAIWLVGRASAEKSAEQVKGRLRTVHEHEAEKQVNLVENARAPLFGPLAGFFWRAGVQVPRSRVVFAAIVWSLVTAGAFFSRGLITAAVAFVLPPAVVYFWLSNRANARRMRIVDQLPLFLENALRVLGTGNTMEESFAAATLEAQDPIRPLFDNIGRQVRLGAPIEQGLMEAGDLYRLRDLKVVALAANVNRRYGGAMRNVLRSVINAIRQRGTSAKELRALTAETRFSALVLFLISTGIICFIYLNNPHYYSAMLATPSGKWILIGSFSLLFVGGGLLWRMVNSIRMID